MSVLRGCTVAVLATDLNLCFDWLVLGNAQTNTTMHINNKTWPCPTGTVEFLIVILKQSRALAKKTLSFL